MRQYKKEEIQVVEKYICNRCGKEMAEEDMLSVDKRWGYFSTRDNEVHHFDLCEKCYDEIVATFQIPIEIDNR
jgi:ribosomal-protein-alanine N-acetyltransferase